MIPKSYQDARSSARKKRCPCRDCNALQQEGTNLIGDADALADQSHSHTVQRLQVELAPVLVATNFIVGRCTASAIASASRKSFFCHFE
jgi:hypothetical protein